MAEEGKTEEVQAVTKIQKKDNFTWRTDTKAWMVGLTSGIICMIAVRWVGWDDSLDEATRQWWTVAIVATCLVLSVYSILAYPCGKYFKKAAEDRNVKTLTLLFVILCLRDLIYVAIVVLLGFVFPVNPYILGVTGFLVGVLYAYWLVIFFKFIQECKARSISFDYSQFGTDPANEPKEKVTGLEVLKVNSII